MKLQRNAAATPKPDWQSLLMLIDSQCENLAAIILCGGQSLRMGMDKANLDFGDEKLLQRVCRMTLPIAQRVVVVAAPAQKLPLLPDSVVVIRDLFPGEGPLCGVVTGLRWLQDNAPETWPSMSIWATTCDAPFVNEAVIRGLVCRLTDAKDKICVSVTHNGRRNPFVAVYRSSVLERAEKLFDAGQRQARQLLDGEDVAFASSSEFQSYDEQLLFLRNCNTAVDLEECRRIVESTAEKSHVDR